MVEVSDYDWMSAVRAARAVAEDLGIPILDDRILKAFENALLSAHEKAVREKAAQQIEAAVAGEMSHDVGDVIRAAFCEAATIARGDGSGS